MLLLGVDHLKALEEGTATDGKMVINERGAVFGPVSTQHRDLKAEGIVYADEYRGRRALRAAAREDVRGHRQPRERAPDRAPARSLILRDDRFDDQLPAAPGGVGRAGFAGRRVAFAGRRRGLGSANRAGKSSSL